MSDYLSDAAAAHFEAVQGGLASLGIPFVLAPRLVRGLDYYRRTTFEFAAEALDAAQNAVGGGGRYDGLVEEMGGPPDRGHRLRPRRRSHAAGLRRRGRLPATRPGGRRLRRRHDRRPARRWRSPRSCASAGLRADRSFDDRSMKAQMKAADRSGAPLALIVGTDELAAGLVAVRSLREQGEQELVARAEIVDAVRKLVDR